MPALPENTAPLSKEYTGWALWLSARGMREREAGGVVGWLPRQEPEGAEVLPEPLGRGVLHRADPEGLSRLDVGRDVVHEHRRPWIEPVPPEQDLEDPPVRLGHALDTGDDMPVEPLHEGEPCPPDKERVRLHVAQRIAGDASCRQLTQHGHGAVDLAGHHLLAALSPGHDHFLVAGVLRGEAAAGLRAIVAEVMRAMPGHGADPGEEVLHLVRIGEELPVQVPRIPVDQHPAEVEDHGVYRPAGHAPNANTGRSRAFAGAAEASRDVKQDRVGYARRALLPLHL